MSYGMFRELKSIKDFPLETAISAPERRKISEQHLAKQAGIQMQAIRERMFDASLDGLFEIRVRYKLAKEVCDYLKELGYHITYSCSSDGTSYTTIDWRE